jgi:hypothetical protein
MLLLAVLLGGCSSTPGWYQYHHNPKAPISIHLEHEVIPIYFDTHFTDEQMTKMGAAIEEWNFALNGTMSLAISEKQFDHKDPEDMAAVMKLETNSMQGIFFVSATSEDDMFEGALPEGVLAYCDGLGEKATTLVMISDRIGNRDYEGIAKHEIAHLLGSSHNGAASLEYSFYGNDQVSCIDKITLANVAHYHRLPLENLNWCRIPGFE